MTCIVGLETEHGTWLGADSFVGGTSFKQLRLSPKIVDMGQGFAFAVAGSIRVEQVAVFVTPPRCVEPGDDEIALLVWLDGLRARLADAGALLVEDGRQRLPGDSDILVAYRGRLWEVGSDFDLLKPQHYSAIGSGFAYATGALAAIHGRLAAEDAIKGALTAAAEHCPTVSRPFFTHWQAVP